MRFTLILFHPRNVFILPTCVRLLRHLVHCLRDQLPHGREENGTIASRDETAALQNHKLTFAN